MIKELIQQELILKPENSRGWEEIRCECCHDYKFRGGFKFDELEITYSCWNCGIAGKYQVNETRMSTKMRGILNSFGITNESIDISLGKAFLINGGGTPKSSAQSDISSKTKYTIIKTPPKELPSGSYKLIHAKISDTWAKVATEYLSSRCIGLYDHEWYLSTDKKYRDRLIIPFYRDSKIIYWQARSYLDNNIRYLNTPKTTRDNIIFGFDELKKYSDTPLFVLEGVFDAISINGCALLGSTLSDTKIQLLERSNREKVFVIDKDQNGKKLGNKALDLGWSVSTIDGAVRDVNQSIQEYGKLWTIGNIMTNIRSGFDGRNYLNVVCKNNNDDWK